MNGAVTIVTRPTKRKMLEDGQHALKKEILEQGHTFAMSRVPLI
jgi:hypothetical protein